MSNTPHELAEEFPQHIEVMHRLKVEDAHFARLFDEYHEVNRAVHRAETRVDAIDDAAEEALRRQRVSLKDQIWSMLSAAAA
jgi:uncharacterized protein YdcH (DUF465 family)